MIDMHDEVVEAVLVTMIAIKTWRQIVYYI